MDYPVDLSYLLDLPREAKERDTKGALDPSGGSSQKRESPSNWQQIQALYLQVAVVC